MPQNKSFISLSVALISIFPWLLSPQSTLAGERIIEGTTIESSSFNNTSDVNQAPAPTGDITIDGGVIRVSDQIQSGLNKDIEDILSDSSNENDIIISLIRGDGIDINDKQILAAFIRTGVKAETVESLKSVLADLLSDAKSVNVNQLNAAIKIHNQIVKESNDGQLIGLNDLPEFKKLNQVLRQLRRTVYCSSNNANRSDDARCTNL